MYVWMLVKQISHLEHNVFALFVLEMRVKGIPEAWILQGKYVLAVTLPLWTSQKKKWEYSMGILQRSSSLQLQLKNSKYLVDYFEKYVILILEEQRMKIQGSSPTSIIKNGLFQGKNSIQVFLMVKDQYPHYDDKKLRKLISVLKSKFIQKQEDL